MARNILITGANRGIGLELTKKFLSEGDNVIALCRKSSSDLSETGARIFENVDVTDLSSLEDASRAIENTLGSDFKIDILINNAGIMRDENIEDFSKGQGVFDSILEQFEVNSLGPFKVFGTFSSHLSSGSKVAMITSRMGSIADNTSGGRYGYRTSKTALNMLSTSLAHDLKQREISVGIFHPGWVQTDMTGKTGHLTPEESASNLFQRITELGPDNTGFFYHCNGERLEW